MTRNKRLRVRLLTEYRRADIQSAGLFGPNLVHVRERIQQALAQPSPYLANNERLVEHLIAEHRALSEQHVARFGAAKTQRTVPIQQGRQKS